MGLEGRSQSVDRRAQIEESSWQNEESRAQMGLEGRWQSVERRLKRVAGERREQNVDGRTYSVELK